MPVPSMKLLVDAATGMLTGDELLDVNAFAVVAALEVAVVLDDLTGLVVELAMAAA